MNGWNIAELVALLGIAGTFFKVVSDYTKLKTNHENLEKMVETQNQSIKELFDSRNETNKTLVQLATILNTLSDQNKSIEKKIDELRDKVSK